VKDIGQQNYIVLNFALEQGFFDYLIKAYT
jgi:hypothetical protein